MECFICGTESSAAQGSGHHCLKCPQCGDYRISNSAMSLLEENQWQLDADMTRRWITSYRLGGSIPMVSSQMAALRAVARKRPTGALAL